MLFSMILGAFLFIFWTVSAVAIPATDLMGLLTSAPL